MQRSRINLVVIKNDIRLHDNPALFYAANQDLPIIVVCIDEKLTGHASRWWRLNAVRNFMDVLADYKIQVIFVENILADFHMIVAFFEIAGIYHNDDLPKFLLTMLIECHITLHKFYPNRLFSDAFSDVQIKVFSAFIKKALDRLEEIAVMLPLPRFRSIHDSYRLRNVMCAIPQIKGIKWWSEMENYWQIGEKFALQKWQLFQENARERSILLYAERRDIMSVNGTSLLSPHIHFGEISVRRMLCDIKSMLVDQSVHKFLSELFWREFSYHTLEHMPDYYYRSKLAHFDKIEWIENDLIIKKWQCGKTGYPIVDAGMRQLWKIGWLPNRVRMIVASFLIKNLHVKWQYGAAWFLDTLVDADVASNAFGWQWISGSGVSASPYFRVMNPFLQSRKFDKDGEYIKRWIHELRDVPAKHLHDVLHEQQYISPIVDLSTTKAAFLKKCMMASRNADLEN
ncbi:Deoxyribodipyrimidine photo-lyase [Candidatus Fokinia solitaria]|uniref:Deoxyribodipyrimidine photo-lyase n=1 Tax=Candidatus Fokinia solitaria TaxID=1802984 RepID=A0A2U8BRJ2_9RICK|nr:deoxyribodipyrimidine photo-lyase [Candidatus Fokinia solitaria]AWD32948.1 Deoxyribodipyrimidine photo-lyase [Candidatus Fokinia solitaria]